MCCSLCSHYIRICVYMYTQIRIHIWSVNKRLQPEQSCICRVMSDTPFSLAQSRYVLSEKTIEYHIVCRICVPPAHKCVYNIHPVYTERVAKGRYMVEKKLEWAEEPRSRGRNHFLSVSLSFSHCVSVFPIPGFLSFYFIRVME